MRSPRPRKTEPQFATPNGWRVDRVRAIGMQHGYEVLYRGQVVGWVGRREDGWRWRVFWSPGTASRAARFSIDRVSTRAYPTWQAAVSHIARTDVGRRIAGSDTPARDAWERHYSVRGQPWEPKPEKSNPDDKENPDA